MKDRLHFHSIDALRFFAFLKVYLLHVPIQGDFPIFSFLKSGGGIGVSFFFVLSGFLITYILVLEKLNSHTLNVKRFLFRRSLRIWPLFYLMVLVAFLLPYDFKEAIGFHMVGGGYEFDWRYSFTFLENYKSLMLDNSPKTTPLSVFWSLCIEEHFYLLWLLMIFFLSPKHILKFLISCFAVAWLARFCEPYIFNNTKIISSDLFTNLDYFAAGGLLGYGVAKDQTKVFATILNIDNKLKWLFILATILMVVFQKQLLPYEPGSLFFIFRSTLIAIVFALLIAIFLPPKSTIKIKSKLMSFLGIRSYGLYVYHIILIHISFQYCIVNEIKIDNLFTLSLYIFLTLGGSILLSSLSYRFFEKPIMGLRKYLNLF